MHGSQMGRQGEVAIQAYIISEALSNVEIPHRVMSFCTFWDYTILHRFREYDAPRSANEDIFNYVTSSNNRDGLAIKTAGYSLLQREEEKKILIVLSDGRPYDMIVNRPNAKKSQALSGKDSCFRYGYRGTPALKPGRQRVGRICRRRKGPLYRKKDFWQGFCLYQGYP